MGTDIRVFVEKKTNNEWTFVAGEFDSNNETPYVIWRHYFLFSILAGVRSEYWPGVKPISEPRGLPTDCSHDLQVIILDENARWTDWQGYAHSWLTLSDILKYDWDQKVYIPNVNGDTYKECCPEFFSRNIPALAVLGDPDDVRIVFWFDS